MTTKVSLFQESVLLEKDYPYMDSKLALELISKHIRKQYDEVEKSPLTGENLKSRCSRSTNELFKFQRYLGYVAKSAVHNNSFEIYFSFRRIANSLLGSDSKLIISSEWDYYSPVNFAIPTTLEDCVFIGLPFAEANNCLIVPLSGHELGHSIWSNSGYKNYREKYKKVIIKKIAAEITLFPSYYADITLQKCEEYFCDIMGIGLFGESYLLAFSYLIAPKVVEEINKSHPSPGHRAEAMLKASNHFGYTTPSNLTDIFKTIKKTGKHITMDYKALMITERIANDQVDMLISDVDSILTSKGLKYSVSHDFEKFRDDIKKMVPISNAKTLGDISNTIWQLYIENYRWPGYEDVSEMQYKFYLNELAIKSFEILEYNQRLERT